MLRAVFWFWTQGHRDRHRESFKVFSETFAEVKQQTEVVRAGGSLALRRQMESKLASLRLNREIRWRIEQTWVERL